MDWTPDLITEENWYRIGNKVYFFNEEQWAQITNIISECKNLDTVIKIVKKNPNVIAEEKDSLLVKCAQCVFSAIDDFCTKGLITLNRYQFAYFVPG
jgi:hypothetical protein